MGVIAAVYVGRRARREGINEDELTLENIYPQASRLLSGFLLACAVSSFLSCRC